MADATPPRVTVSGSGTVTVRQRPALLLMKLRLRAAEATLELGLAKLKQLREGAAVWLKRLGAERVEFGEPHFAETAEKDPMAAAQAAATKRFRKPPAGDRKREVCLVVTALWPIAALSPDDVLLLVDRLRFESTDDTGPAEAAEELPSWASPEEQVREMMSRLQQPPPDDPSPQFLFVARLDPERAEAAGAEAYALACRNAQRLARVAGQRVGRLSSVRFDPHTQHTVRTDKMMDRQRCAAILSGCAYDPTDDELVSDDPRPAEFRVGVSVTYLLEDESKPAE
jgi:hypothetical protein